MKRSKVLSALIKRPLPTQPTFLSDSHFEFAEIREKVVNETRVNSEMNEKFLKAGDELHAPIFSFLF